MQDIAAEELAALGVDAGFQVINPLIQDHVREFGLERLSVPIGTSQAAAASAIELGIAGGESIGEIARRLISVGTTDQGWRARMIARTEIVRSANIARVASWEGSGLPGLKKQWLSALTADTRGSHAALHNNKVDLGAVFTFSGALEPGIAATTQSPGDTGVAAHDINCICSTIAFDPEHGKALTFGGPEHIARMKSFDQLRDPWEKQAVKDIEAFYKEIEKATLEILGVKKSDL